VINESFIFALVAVALWPIGAVAYCLVEKLFRWGVKKVRREPSPDGPRLVV
jgi:hypothetical protein